MTAFDSTALGPFALRLKLDYRLITNPRRHLSSSKTIVPLPPTSEPTADELIKTTPPRLGRCPNFMSLRTFADNYPNTAEQDTKANDTRLRIK